MFATRHHQQDQLGKQRCQVDNEYLSYLIFSDDVALIADFTSKLQEMLQDIHDTSNPVGLKMHLGKTKLMYNKHVKKDNVIVDGKKIRLPRADGD